MKPQIEETYRIRRSVIFYREDDKWIAHCLELDLIGHGDTKAAAVKLLNQAIYTQIHAVIKYKNFDNFFTFEQYLDYKL